MPLASSQRSGATSDDLGQRSWSQSTPSLIRDPYEEAMQRRAQDITAGGQQLQYQASILPYNQKQARFNVVFPWLQRQWRGMNSAMMGGGLARPGGGEITPPPSIINQPLYSPQRIDQSINNTRSLIAQQTAGDIERLRGSLAGSGQNPYGGLAESIAGQKQAAGMATQYDQANSMRREMEKAQAQHALAASTADRNAWTQREQVDIERKKPYWQNMGYLVQSLSGLAGNMV